LNTKSGGLDHPRPCDQIDSDDYPYLVRGYPSNHVGFVGYRLEISPYLPPIHMKGYGRLRTPIRIPIEHIYFIYLSSIGVDVT
jgi:hypothetical protein